MQRGRQSAAALAVVPIDSTRSRPKLTPISSLSKQERRVFDHTARENPHLRTADVPLLEVFAMAYVRVSAARKKSAGVWERENRILLAIGTKLRVTQQAVTDSRTAARLRAQVNPSIHLP